MFTVDVKQQCNNNNNLSRRKKRPSRKQDLDLKTYKKLLERPRNGWSLSKVMTLYFIFNDWSQCIFWVRKDGKIIPELSLKEHTLSGALADWIHIHD